MKFLLFFIVLNVVNVILQTVKSIATVKCKAFPAALVNAIAFGLYTVVVVYTTTEALDLFGKVIVTALTNLIGVYVVKKIEEKNRKDKLWKVEATFDREYLDDIKSKVGLPYNYIEIGDKVIVNFYCDNHYQSIVAKDIVTKYHGKYFVSESKTL